jgi:hypothetical protein
LQPGDKIDALDNTKIWYKSIVVKREFRIDNYNEAKNNNSHNGRAAYLQYMRKQMSSLDSDDVVKRMH